MSPYFICFKVKYFFSTCVLRRYQIAISICKNVINGICRHGDITRDLIMDRLNYIDFFFFERGHHNFYFILFFKNIYVKGFFLFIIIFFLEDGGWPSQFPLSPSMCGHLIVSRVSYATLILFEN